MSKFLDTQKQIAALQAELEALREAEFVPAVADIKSRIEAFGIKPEDLFTAAELSGKKAAPKRARVVPKYALNGHTWGGRGAVPKWYAEALASGKTPDELLIRQ